MILVPHRTWLSTCLYYFYFYRFGPGAIFTFLCPYTGGEMRRGAVNIFVAQLLVVF